MDDTTRQARERREQAQDFLTANPNAHSVGIGGTIYDCNGYEMARNMIEETLKLYGAGLTPAGNVITPRGLETNVELVVHRGRLRAEGEGQLLFSGPATPAAVCRFVENFWYWSKSGAPESP
jgi:hypothetical protein